jgi:single-strand DNA-binding protein
MINKVILVGNVGADPEVRYISDGVVTARIRLATTEVYTDKSGQRVDKTEWHSINVWNQLAKTVEQYVKKGMQLYVEGKLTTRSYEKNGETRYVTDIVANEIKFLGRKSDNSNGGSQQTQYAQPVAKPAAATPAAPAFEEAPIPADDLPF